MRHFLCTCAALLCLALASCGGNPTRSNSPSDPTAPATGPAVPPSGSASVVSSSHVVLVVLENRRYSDVIGSLDMPYLNGLANQYALATQYFANAHFSIPNYFMLTTGQLETLDDNFAGTISDDNLARELNAAGRSWRVYAEGLPSAGYLGGDSGLYVKRHNPFAYFTNVVNSASQAANIVPFSQFSADLSSGKLPDFSLVVPDIVNDSHDGTPGQADDWLKANIAPVLSSPQFQSSGLLIVTFDESDPTDLEHGGGHIATVLAGPKIKSAYRSSTLYQHQSMLRLVLEALGVSKWPGAAAGAPSMEEFFQQP